MVLAYNGEPPVRHSKDIIIKQDRQAIATLLCELLEGLKPQHQEDENPHTGVSIDAVNTFLTKAKAIIRQTLEGKQE